jgi:hypothetical protein
MASDEQKNNEIAMGLWEQQTGLSCWCPVSVHTHICNDAEPRWKWRSMTAVLEQVAENERIDSTCKGFQPEFSPLVMLLVSTKERRYN